MTTRRRTALVGYGKIARDQHRPALDADPAFELVGIADPLAEAQARGAGVPAFPSLAALLDADLGIEVVVLCQPPQRRFDDARLALESGLHVLLEKPPCATVREAAALAALAEDRGVTLFAAWHSRHAPAVPPARDWLATRRPLALSIDWLEDVREWHPGQRWIWEPGGLGTFDAGINAFSILTTVLPGAVSLGDGTLSCPANRCTPIAAEVSLRHSSGATGRARFDWRQPGPPRWDLRVSTEDGELLLAEGGARLWIAGEERDIGPAREYAEVYRHFGRLISAGRSDVDLAPLQLVADAFLRSRLQSVADFHEERHEGSPACAT